MLQFYRKNKGFRQFLALISGALGYFIVGASFAWTSVALVKLQDEDTPISITDSEGSTIASIFVVGVIIGPFIYGFFVDLLGRKWLMLIGLVLHVVHWMVLYFSVDLYQIYIGRIILGFAITFVVSVLPTYIGEVTDKSSRSIFGILMAMQVPLGSIFMYGVGPYLGFYTLCLVTMIISICIIFLWLFMVESPYYLVRQNKPKEAMKCLMWLRAETDEKQLENEMKEIDSFVKESPKRSFKEIVKEVGTRSNRLALALITLLTFGSQFNGATAVRTYFHSIITSTGTELDVNLSVIFLELIGFVVLMSSFFMIDRFGRKFLFLLSCGGCLVGTFLTGLYFMLSTYDIIGNEASSMALVAILCTQTFNAFGASSVPAIITSEVSSASLRSFFGAYYSIGAGGFGAINMKLFEVLESNFGIQYSFWLYSICTFIVGIILIIIMPETKGKSLQEIQDMLGKKNQHDHTNKTKESKEATVAI